MVFEVLPNANKWFSSYLAKRQQHASINGSVSQTRYVEHGVPQGSVLGPLLFLVYINHLNNCIRFSTTRHFADDTNLLHTIDLSKNRNRNPTRNLNRDLKSLNHWLLANKISLNATKTEIIYFRNRRTQIPKNNIKLHGVRLTSTDNVKYVGVIFDEYLTFDKHIKTLNAKLKRANNLLAISRQYLPKPLLNQIYYGQFYSHLTYGCQLWGQNEHKISQTIILQKKAIRLLSFSHYQATSSPLFKSKKLVKLTDIIKSNNILFTHNTLNNKSPHIFKDYFKLKEVRHHHQTINNLNSTFSIPAGSLNVPTFRTNAGKFSIQNICATTWNDTLKELSMKNTQKYNTNPFWLQNMKIHTLKHILKWHFLDQY